MFFIEKFPFRNLNIKSIKYFVFIIYLISGILIFADYGLSWDENTQRNTGIVFSKEICNYLGINCLNNNPEIPSLDEYGDREFGAVFEIFLFGVERIVNPEDIRQVFLIRHVINFIVFAFSLLIFWLIIENRTKTWWLGMAGFVILGLHPRLFADSFYNSKDIILLSFFIFCMYFINQFIYSGKMKHIAGLGIISALAFNIRPAGILMPFALIITMLIIYFSKNTTFLKRFKSVAFYAGSLLFIFGVFAIVFNPYLWEKPFLRIFEILTKFLNYNLSQTAGNTFFMGEFLPSDQLPWYYSPVWMFVSTPLFSSILIFFGLVCLLISLCRTETNTSYKYFSFILFLWFFVPIFLIIISKSTLYDGWRHLFFVFPALVGLSLIGVKTLIESIHRLNTRLSRIIKNGLIFLIFISGFEGLTAIVKHHPYQYCYFNFMVSHPEKRFEIDYWGVSYLDLLKYLVQNDENEMITLKVLNLPAYHNAYLLKAKDRERLFFDASIDSEYATRLKSFYPVGNQIKLSSKLQYPDYYLSNFRNTSDNIELMKFKFKYPPYDKPIKTIKFGEMVISGIYRLE